jgi:hypothetical protein
MMAVPTNEHTMRSHIFGDGYVTLTWPKNLTVEDIDLVQSIVLLQLNVFRKHAQRRVNADLEYESWFPVNDGKGE